MYAIHSLLILCCLNSSRKKTLFFESVMTFFYNNFIYSNTLSYYRSVSCILLFDAKFSLIMKLSRYLLCFFSKMCLCKRVCKNSQVPTPRKRNEGEMNRNHALQSECHTISLFGMSLFVLNGHNVKQIDQLKVKPESNSICYLNEMFIMPSFLA